MAFRVSESNVTAKKREPLVIEITDEAYKQNSVYRPWDETDASRITADLGASFTKHQLLKILAAFNREQAASVMPV
jgi:hypothetical protein